MKRSIKNIILIGFVLSITQCSMADDIITEDLNKLPLAAKECITTHFSDHNISYIEIDNEIFGNNYEVIFTNGAKIEFDSQGQWKEIKCKRSSVPSALIPSGILDYLNKNFQDDKVVKIEKKQKKYELELSNGLELLLDTNGKLYKIDD